MIGPARLWAALILALFGQSLFAPAALAEMMPLAGPGDPHIQSVAYDPQEVVALHVAPGYALTVLFSPDERIETATLGDAGAWQVTVNHAADRLVVKPLHVGAPTNLTVISDQRTYNFSLYGFSGAAQVQAYTVSFTYPPPPAPPPATEPLPPGRYKLHGDRALWPMAMSDNGEVTEIRWGAQMPFPAVYRDDGDGMALVNGVMLGGVYRVEGVHKQLIFLAGNARASARRISERIGK